MSPAQLIHLALLILAVLLVVRVLQVTRRTPRPEGPMGKKEEKRGKRIPPQGGSGTAPARPDRIDQVLEKLDQVVAEQRRLNALASEQAQALEIRDVVEDAVVQAVGELRKDVVELQELAKRRQVIKLRLVGGQTAEGTA